MGLLPDKVGGTPVGGVLGIGFLDFEGREVVGVMSPAAGYWGEPKFDVGRVVGKPQHLIIIAVIPMGYVKNWRRGRDLNPRDSCETT